MDYQPPIDLYQRLALILQDELDTKKLINLHRQLTKLEAVRYELSQTRCKWGYKLSSERERLRMPKSSEYTEFDRKTMSDAAIALIDTDYQFLLALEIIVKERLELGQSILQTI